MGISNRTGAIVLTTGQQIRDGRRLPAHIYGDMNGGLAVLADVTKKLDILGAAST